MGYKIKIKKMKAYADVGSNGGIYMFEDGTIANKYPTLLHIYKDKISPDLQPVTISYLIEED